MKKIFGLILALVLLVSVFAVLPASAEESEAKNGWNVLLNSGIVLNYYENGAKVESVDVAAKEMAVNHTVNGHTTSVKEYLQGLIDGNYGENTKALAQALLNYGAAAQKYFNYQADSLVGTPVTNTADLIAADAPAKVVNDADGIYLGATLVLDGTMKLRLYFKGETRTGTVDGTDNVSAKSNGDGNCYFEVAVMPYAISESVTVVVDNTTVTYAPINYLQAKAENADLSEMVASIYAYGVAAKTYSVTDGCEHQGDMAFEIVKQPTIFTEGKQEGYCATCGKYLEDAVAEKTELIIHTFTPDTNKTTDDAHTFESILDGGNKHFYPTEDDPDGKSLYIEYSMLWSEEFVNAQIGQGYMLLGRFDSAAKSYDDSYDTAYALSIGSNDGWTDHGTPGHFDVLGKAGDSVDGDFTYSKPDVTTFPSIGGYGWHRIGIVIKQINSTHLNATLYIDGVKLSSHNINPRNTDNLLYTEKNGEYQDIDLNRVVRAYYFGESKAEYDVDFKIADLFVTAGDGFVLPVTKLDTPVGYDGFEGEFHFDYNDCDLEKHSWTDGVTVISPVTCTKDGKEGIKCTVCGTIKEDTVVVIPAVGSHTWDESTETTVTENTFYSDGLKTCFCSACGEEISEVISKKPVDITLPFIVPGNNKTIDDSHSFDTILDGGKKHFYPTKDDPDGKALYIEYSMLWTEDFVNAQIGQGYMLLGRFDSAAKSYDNPYDTAYALSIGPNDGWTDHGTPGYFDVLRKDGAPVDGDFTYSKPDASTYPSIGGYGWHRIGIVIKQINSTHLNATLYIDGVKLSSHNIKLGNTDNLLYTEKNGEYQDIDLNRVVRAYYFGESKAEYDVDFKIADLFVTAGDGFVMPVTKLDEAVNVPEVGDIYFNYKSAGDCKLENHSWADSVSVVTSSTCTTDGAAAIKCTICGAVKSDTTVVIPAPGHAWATKATVDVEPTCIDPGSQSIKCTVCGEKNAETVEPVPPAGQHTCAEEDFDIVTEPTLFSDGLKTGTCSVCKEVFDAAIPKSESVTTEQIPKAGRGTIMDAHSFSEILDGGNKHFYPTKDDPDGKSLYIEYSMLWSEEFVNAQIGKGYMLLGRFDSGASKQDGTYDIAYGLSIGANDGWTDPKTPGYFDVLRKDGAPVDGDYTYSMPDVTTYPSIGGYGWHRIGIVIKQINSTHLNATLYIDGVKLSSHNIKLGNTANLLYTEENGEYKDIDLDRVVRAYYFGESDAKYDVDFEIADLYVTAGDGFVMPVTKLDKAVNVPEFGDEVKVYFYYNAVADCTDENHTWTDWSTVTVPTMFSDGLQSKTCLACREELSEDIPMTEPTVREAKSSESADVMWNYERHLLKDLVSEDNHFYDENNSLYIEYSILVNETFDDPTKNAAAWFILGMISDKDNGNFDKIGWLHRDANDDPACPYVGGVEPNGDVTKFYEDNSIVEMVKNANGKWYYRMKEELYYGWHRIGVKIDQTHEGKGDGAEYTVTATIFIDGERIMDMTYDNWESANLLYTVDENGVCHDNDSDDTWVSAVVMQRLIPQSGKIYIPVADAYVTCGDGFVLPVTKLDDSIEGTFSPEDGVTLDADCHFAYVTD